MVSTVKLKLYNAHRFMVLPFRDTLEEDAIDKGLMTPLHYQYQGPEYVCASGSWFVCMLGVRWCDLSIAMCSFVSGLLSRVEQSSMHSHDIRAGAGGGGGGRAQLEGPSISGYELWRRNFF